MSNPLLIAAQSMARVVRQDPQFRLPKRPRFPREYVIVTMQDGLLIEGAEERQVLRGAAATTLVPKLIDLLDGTRTLEDLECELGSVPAEHIEAAIALLYTRGLLEDAEFPSIGKLNGANPLILAFLRRHIDVTRLNKNAEEAYARLCTATVAIIADDMAAEESLAEELAAAGIRDVVVTKGQISAIPLDRGLIIAMSLYGTENWLEQVDDIRARYGIPWMRVAMTGRTLECGPYFDPEGDRCYKCFAVQREFRPLTPSPDWARDFAIGTACIEVIYMLTKLVISRIINETTIVNLSDWSVSRCKVVRIPGCPQCLPDAPPCDVLPTALAFEDAIDLPPKHLINLKMHQVHYSPHSIALQKIAKRYPNAEAIPLPSSSLDEMKVPIFLGTRSDKEAHLDATRGLDIRELSTLLLCTGGIREERPDGTPIRWAATGGNLGSVGLYVAALAVRGLSAGLYFYAPFDHALVNLPTSELPGVDSTQFSGRSAPVRNGTSAYIIFTGAYGRMSTKYYSTGYRIVHLDAGVAVSQALAVAQACAIDARLIASWDEERIQSLLQLEGSGELVTSIMAVTGAGGQC